jgi:hypothetical protein
MVFGFYVPIFPQKMGNRNFLLGEGLFSVTDRYGLSFDRQKYSENKLFTKKDEIAETQTNHKNILKFLNYL